MNVFFIKGFLKPQNFNKIFILYRRINKFRQNCKNLFRDSLTKLTIELIRSRAYFINDVYAIF